MVRFRWSFEMFRELPACVRDFGDTTRAFFFTLCSHSLEARVNLKRIYATSFCQDTERAVPAFL